MRRWTKRILGAGVMAGAAYALWKVLDERSRSSSLEWTPQPFPSPPKPVPHPDARSTAPAVTATSTAASSPDAGDGWVAPEAGACPLTHPVKAKLGSGIFHVPGGQMYDRTVPDRCYRDAASAEAEGLRASKR